ncbi:TPA: cupin domain-containing protein [Bacillus cereus]|nr:cupin domain-containing protein [Bacillus cereus]
MRAFHSGDFYTPIDFIDYIEVPPKARIGLHKHQLNEEIYFIISGNGEMNMNGEIKRVKPGDIIVNSVYDTHGLTNDSNENINIFIFQVSSQK